MIKLRAKFRLRRVIEHSAHRHFRQREQFNPGAATAESLCILQNPDWGNFKHADEGDIQSVSFVAETFPHHLGREDVQQSQSFRDCAVSAPLLHTTELRSCCPALEYQPLQSALSRSAHGRTSETKRTRHAEMKSRRALPPCRLCAKSPIGIRLRGHRTPVTIP